MERVLFKEEQKFRQFWLWMLIAVSLLTPIVLMLWQAVATYREGSQDFLLMLFLLLFILVITIPVVWLLYFSKLVIEIRSDGIWFQFPPMLNRWKCIRKDEIESYIMRVYKPVWEFGGWGIKGGRRNKAYNVSGNIGLQICLKDGKKVLFGTQKKQAVELAMKKMMK